MRCAEVRPKQVGVKQTLGRLRDDVKGPGAVFVTPLTTRVVKVQVATTNLAITENRSSMERLTVKSESSILYSVNAPGVPRLRAERDRIEVDAVEGWLAEVARRASALAYPRLARASG